MLSWVILIEINSVKSFRSLAYNTFNRIESDKVVINVLLRCISFALKGSKRFVLFCYHYSGCCAMYQP